MDNFNELLFGFKEHLKIKNYSKASIGHYTQHHLQGFFEYLKANGITDIKRVTRDMLKTYHVGLMEKKTKADQGYTVSTVATKIRTVKRFFEYLEASNHILFNPAEYIKEPKKEYRFPRVILTEDEARKILDKPNLSTMTGIRDRTVLEVFYSTGIRLEELINLTIFDCDLQGGMLRVNKGKFSKDRVVPLGRHAVKFLKEYITHVRPHFTRNNKTVRNLFINQTGKPLSSQVIQIKIRAYAKEAGVQKKVSPHVFRHTFATQLVKNGADITAVQKMLGHSTLSITHIYTRVAGVDVKRTHKDHHPREKDNAVKEDIAPDIRMVRGPYKDERP